MSLGDWRRDNINRLIQRLYTEIKDSGSSAKFSIAPFGLYRPGHPDGMPPPIEGTSGYDDVYGDSRWWLQQGWMDIFIPQIYWEIDPVEQSYPIVLDWWLDENNASVLVYAGNAIHKILPDRNDWPVSEIQRQIDVSRDPERREKLSLGNVAFSAKYFRDNTKNITEIFRTETYTEKATPPL